MDSWFTPSLLGFSLGSSLGISNRLWASWRPWFCRSVYINMCLCVHTSKCIQTPTCLLFCVYICISQQSAWYRFTVQLMFVRSCPRVYVKVFQSVSENPHWWFQILALSERRCVSDACGEGHWEADCPMIHSILRTPRWGHTFQWHAIIIHKVSTRVVRMDCGKMQHCMNRP